MFRFLPILFLGLIFSCSTNKDKNDNTTSVIPKVAVVNYPLYYFANTIAGENASVYLPALAGDPAYWKPNAQQVNNFQEADMIFVNGADYAKWIKKVSLPSSKIVITSEGFKDQWIETQEGVAHSHGPEGEHVHKGTAFTTWLNFSFAQQQAKVIYQALVKLLPEKEAELTKNYSVVEQDLAELNGSMKILSKKLGDQPIIASHPIYQYLESAYDLDIISLHWEPEEMPDDKEWTNLKNIIKDHQALGMIWEAEPSDDIKTKLNELNVPFAVFNPCANKPPSGDFIKVMNKNIKGVSQLIIE